ncbi:MAG: 50S ribosomal protein L25, partial [Candidatus Andersenbacteria bacterium]|nr:50S ribosomal protein L25 [Candidatus Andersenbacteria bacterium]
ASLLFPAGHVTKSFMAQSIKLKAETRDQKTNTVRSGGDIPAVLYGHSIKNQNIKVNAQSFDRVFEQSGFTTLLNLDVAGKAHHVLIRDIQLHPLKGDVTHIDFYQVRLDEKVTAEVPLVAVGESPAVKDKGGIFVRNMDTLEIEALPQNLPHEIPFDISAIAEFDEPIHVSDLNIPEGVAILSAAEEVVALVQPPRSEEELEQLSEEAVEDVESVEGVKDKEPEAEGENAGEESAKKEETPAEDKK